MNIQEKIDDIKAYGFTSLPCFLDEKALQDLVNAVKPHLGKAEKEYGTSKNKDITLAMYRTPQARRIMRDIVFGEQLNAILGNFIDKPFVEHTKILVKAPNGPDTPWHQDGAFWQDFDPDKSMLSLWIALEPVTIENGCLEIIKASSFKGKLIEHEKVRNGLELEIPDSSIQKALKGGEIKSMELKPGDALIFDSTTIHRALPNQTDAARIGMKVVFQDQRKRCLSVPKHKSSMEMLGFKGQVNKVLPCAITARRA